MKERTLCTLIVIASGTIGYVAPMALEYIQDRAREMPTAPTTIEEKIDRMYWGMEER